MQFATESPFLLYFGLVVVNSPANIMFGFAWSLITPKTETGLVTAESLLPTVVITLTFIPWGTMFPCSLPLIKMSQIALILA